MSAFLQYLFSGLTVGAVYAVVAIGFTLIYAASDVVNFAQGEFVMLGGMCTVFFAHSGIALPLAAFLAVVVTVLVGIALQKMIEAAGNASPATLIIITLGASIFLRGVASVLFGKQFHSLSGFSGSEPLHWLGAAVLPQALWVLAGALVMFATLWFFLERMTIGVALRASAANRLAARMVGINISLILMLAFGLSAALGAMSGVLVTPISLTRYDIGALLALKGFTAAIFGGLGNPAGAVLGGLALGLLESFAAGYLTSVYKDGIAFIALILILLTMPNGLLGGKVTDRV
ncbi:branched-chain amino acid ABC transporter permease (plasmid) [Paraburkholderia sp. PREW-6R]|uniref:branched-chain amino acid ABC transporter permease n=1 Tax=Paraburkholderia sp. PREW-6R TaxID=3141544 RepID=UPI0031F4A098